MIRKLFLLLALVSLLAACAPTATQESMMESKPTEKMMEGQMPATGGDTMMKASATPEMMEAMPTKSMDAMMSETATLEMMDATPTHDPMMGKETPSASMMEGDGMMAPAWFNADLRDEVTGKSFKIEDFKDKVVLVELFAQWCPTCLAQQNEVVKLHEALGMPDDLVTVSLDIDPKEDAEMLKMYLEKHGFDWHFAIAPKESTVEIGKLYGDPFLNPSAAPMLIIDRHGEVHPLDFGIKTAEDLQEALKPFLNEGM